MAEQTPILIVPGFYGYVANGVAEPMRGPPSQALVNLWLSLIDERLEQPESYEIAIPTEEIICRELPPDVAIQRLADGLVGHRRDDLLYFFAYDWRKSLIASATRLAEELDQLVESSGIAGMDIVAVGPGCLVVRYLMESGTLAHGARRVRRIVLVAPPNRGIPCALLLLAGILARRESDPVVSDLLKNFPSTLQLIPPHGSHYLYRAGQPSERIEPLVWPELFLRSRLGGAGPSQDLTREMVDCNAALHTRLRTAHAPSWRNSLVLASSSMATFSHLDVVIEGGEAGWDHVTRTPFAGDGLVPITSALGAPGMRALLQAGRHRDLVAEGDVAKRCAAFFAGPLT